MRQYPSSPREDVLAAWLAAGPDDAVVSHESALEILGLSDIVPDSVHLTVARSRRYRPRIPGARLHTTIRELSPSDVAVRDGIRLTSAVRSIVDAAESGIAPDQVLAAAREALDRGMATERRLLEAARQRGRRVEQLIRHAIEERRGQ
jgi:predicted transcriptional regulator of viral defense system